MVIIPKVWPFWDLIEIPKVLVWVSSFWLKQNSNVFQDCTTPGNPVQLLSPLSAGPQDVSHCPCTIKNLGECPCRLPWTPFWTALSSLVPCLAKSSHVGSPVLSSLPPKLSNVMSLLLVFIILQFGLESIPRQKAGVNTVLTFNVSLCLTDLSGENSIFLICGPGYL